MEPKFKIYQDPIRIDELRAHRHGSEISHYTGGISLWDYENSIYLELQTRHDCLTGKFEQDQTKQIKQVVRDAKGDFDLFRSGMTSALGWCKQDQRDNLSRYIDTFKVENISRISFLMPDMNLIETLKSEVSNALFPGEYLIEVHVTSIEKLEMHIQCKRN